MMAASLGSAAASGQQTLLFDFGSESQRTSGPWNNVTAPFDTGTLVEAATDTSGRPTRVHLRQLDGWGGVNIKGHFGDGPYPSWAMRDSFFLSAETDSLARLRLDGLDSARRYSLGFYGSRVSETNHRTAVIKIGSRVARLDAFNNRSGVTRIDNVAPDAEGGVTIEFTPLGPEHHAYLGVLEVRGSFADAPATPRGAESLAGPPLVSAQAWAVAEADSGRLVRGFRASEVRPIASATKIMTALVVSEMASADASLWTETVTVSSRAASLSGTTARLQAGDRLSLQDAFFGMLLPSGNDAAQALAEHCGARLSNDPPNDSNDKTDSAQAFVALMNDRARQLGMAETRFFDPHGNGENFGSACDLLRAAREALRHPIFSEAVSTRERKASVIGDNRAMRSLSWANTNRLLDVEGYDGVKTGTTDKAGACLVARGRRGDDCLLVVVMGCPGDEQRYIDARNLFRWAWQRRSP